MMDEHEEREARATFESLRGAVQPTVDVDSQLAELHGLARRQPRSRKAATLLGAAAVVVGLVVGGTALLGDDGDQRVLSDGGRDDAAVVPSTTAPEDLCDEGQLFVYMVPDAPVTEVDHVDAVLTGSEAVESFEFMDREATFEEFQRLFEGQSDFVSAIRPEELPESFRVDLAVEPTEVPLEEWETLPGVLRIDLSDQYDCGLANARAELHPDFRPMPLEECAGYSNLEEVAVAGEEAVEKCGVPVLAIRASDGSVAEMSTLSGQVSSQALNDALSAAGSSPIVMDLSVHPEVQLHLVRSRRPTFAPRSASGAPTADVLVVVLGGSDELVGPSSLQLRSDGDVYRALESLLTGE